MKTTPFFLTSLLGLSAALACSVDTGYKNPTGGDGDGDVSPAEGSEGGLCFEDGTCDVNLTCASNLCVELDAEGAGATGSGATGAGAMAGQGSGGDDASSGGVQDNMGGSSLGGDTGSGGATVEPCEEGARDCVDIENGSEILACEDGVWVKGTLSYYSCSGTTDGECLNDDTECIVDEPSYLNLCVEGAWVEWSGCEVCSEDGKTCEQ